jgi:hypothetical protein
MKTHKKPEPRNTTGRSEDSEAILDRRRFLIQAALAGAGVGAVLSTGQAADPPIAPQPCLKNVPPKPPTNAPPGRPPTNALPTNPQPCLSPPTPKPCLAPPRPQPCLSVAPPPKVCLSIRMGPSSEK